MKNLIALGVGVAVGLSMAPPANADYTPYRMTPSSGELGHRSILSGIYGSGFDRIGSSFDFTNGTITATRIDDFGVGGIMNIVDGGPGQADDQVFDDGFVEARATAKYSHTSGQSFGLIPGESGGSYQTLFDVEGYGFAVSGSMDLTDLGGETWRWGHHRVRPAGTTVTHSSRQLDNPRNDDWMVTYQVTGLDDGWTTWLLFWEARTGGGRGDFNDLVIEVRAARAPVPAPGALVLGGLGLGLVGWLKRRVS